MNFQSGWQFEPPKLLRTLDQISNANGKICGNCQASLLHPFIALTVLPSLSFTCDRLGDMNDRVSLVMHGGGRFWKVELCSSLEMKGAIGPKQRQARIPPKLARLQLLACEQCHDVAHRVHLNQNKQDKKAHITLGSLRKAALKWFQHVSRKILCLPSKLCFSTASFPQRDQCVCAKHPAVWLPSVSWLWLPGLLTSGHGGHFPPYLYYIQQEYVGMIIDSDIM